ncbi:hypothetical protein TELCIR_18476, partial [Teladorsagia circumcincta]
AGNDKPSKWPEDRPMLSSSFKEPRLPAKPGTITKEQAEKGKQLSVVGIAGTIDNDFIGTDRTIGFDSAMARVTECVDNLTATAMSHHRTFIVEVDL